jgi:hypothetical protein
MKSKKPKTSKSKVITIGHTRPYERNHGVPSKMWHRQKENVIDKAKACIRKEQNKVYLEHGWHASCGDIARALSKAGLLRLNT